MKHYRVVRPSFFLIVGFFVWIAGCSSSGDSVEHIPRQVLLSSSEGLMIEGKEITLTANLTRDFAPSTPAEGRPLIARIEIVVSNGEILPVGLDTDAVWVLVDDQIWGSSYSGEQFKNDRTRLVKIAREGPKFGVTKKAVVIARIHHNGSTYLLKSTGQRIQKTS